MGFPYHGEMAKHNKKLKAFARVDTVASLIRITLILMEKGELHAATHTIQAARKAVK